ncbi:signal peptidase II [Gracilimonas mengyeensis]|uniref:Lipoprotein signal peptidase n=1 Tax=Gracilimonas mengyeensis TaxID=1302730 RepID=A0A521EM28_9BACT|nr:signal peptidase II [Gracilimonas mengyeensis]SMO84977.1 signal peptidase II [Gracilimonas mengyeensis]
MTSKKLTALFAPAIFVLIIDQLTKWWVRTTPELHNKTLIEGWLQFYFTKNPGMALGIDVLSTPVISTIAILAVTGILVYVMRHIYAASIGYLVCMGLILGGAFGNIADRIFMGIIGGYGGVLDGHVVDFIYFSLEINDWTVFPYIFNIADVAISASIILLLVFNKRFFVAGTLDGTEPEETSETDIPDSIDPETPPAKNSSSDQL